MHVPGKANQQTKRDHRRAVTPCSCKPAGRKRSVEGSDIAPAAIPSCPPTPPPPAGSNDSGACTSPWPRSLRLHTAHSLECKGLVANISDASCLDTASLW
eukprot:1160508-Pelagomonas_calceolata.AAC.8